jgi:MoxR-like ATPase
LDGGRILQMQALVREVISAPHVKDYATRLVWATHPESELAPERVRRFVRYGASPRGAQALILAGKVRALTEGRFNVSYEDIRVAAHNALRHRILLNFEGEAEGIRTDEVITEILESVQPEVEAAKK